MSRLKDRHVHRFFFITFFFVLFFSTCTNHTLRSALISLGAAIGATNCAPYPFCHRAISTHLSCSPKTKNKKQESRKDVRESTYCDPCDDDDDRPHFPANSLLFLSVFLRVLPDRRARPVSEHSGGNVHRLELLEQELGRIRDVNLRNLGLVLAWPALERLLGKVAKETC